MALGDMHSVHMMHRCNNTSRAYERVCSIIDVYFCGSLLSIVHMLLTVWIGIGMQKIKRKSVLMENAVQLVHPSSHFTVTYYAACKHIWVGV